MTIYEKMLSYFQGTEDHLHISDEIKSNMQKWHGANPTSVIPSDYCYNRWNYGVTSQKPILIRVGPGEYRYIGPDQPYSGLIYGRPRGEKEDQVVGEWKKGQRTLY
jgi:hypothetical protein